MDLVEELTHREECFQKTRPLVIRCILKVALLRTRLLLR